MRPIRQKSLVATPESVVRSVLERLRAIHSVAPSDPIIAYHEATATLYQLASAARQLELVGWSPETIRDALAPARDLLSSSAFINRLQKWPRGYRGDFETVEHILDNANRTEPHTWGSYFERSALATAIAEQHRNKVRIQAHFVKTLISEDIEARVLLLACGSCPDLFSIKSSLAGCELVINDRDPEALAFSIQRLAPNPVTPIQGDVLRAAKRLVKANRKFDVIVAGGIFDYLPQPHATALLADIWRLLETGGSALITNIAKGNPFRTWMEYSANWSIIERDEQEISVMCRLAGIPGDGVRTALDQTQLAWLITLEKQGPHDPTLVS